MIHTPLAIRLPLLSHVLISACKISSGVFRAGGGALVGGGLGTGAATGGGVI